MKGPQDIRREKEYNLIPDNIQRNGDEFGNDSKYLRQISALQEENEFLRSLSNRVQTELKEYQIRFPQILVEDNNLDSKQSHDNGDVNGLQNSDLEPWISSSKYMSPLLVAYDSKIKELNEQIKMYQQNALEIKKASNVLINKNEELQNEMETKIVSLYKKLKIKNKHHINNDGDDEVLDDYDCNEYQQRVNILNQQNKLLRETEIRWKKEKEDYLKIINENRKNIELLQKEVNRVHSLNEEFEELSSNLKYENTELKEINNELRNNVIKKLNEKSDFLEQRLKIESTEHREVKTRLNEYENEYNALNDNHSELDDKYKRIESENTELIHKMEALNDEIIEHKNALSSNKSRLERMIESLTSIENILEMYKNKEFEYLKQINDLKENNDLFVNVERDKLMTEKDMYLDQIKTLENENKDILERIQKEYDIKLDKLKLEYTQKQEIFNKNIDDLMMKIVILKEERHEFENKYNTTEKDLEAIKKIYLTKFETLNSTENELKCKITELKSENERYLELSQRKEATLSEQSTLWQSEREIYNRTISDLNENDDKKNLTLIQNEEEILDLSTKIEQLNGKLKVNQIQNTKHIQELSNKLTKSENVYNETIEHYKKEIKNLENLYDESQIKTKQIINKHESLSTKWKQENRNSFANLSKIIDELKKENKSLINCNIELENKISNIIHDQKNTISSNINIKKKLQNTEDTISLLNQNMDNIKSLNAKYQNKEMLLLRENKNLRNQLNQANISMQRLQRNHQFNLKITSH